MLLKVFSVRRDRFIGPRHFHHITLSAVIPSPTITVLSKGSTDVHFSAVPSNLTLYAINAHAKSSAESELKVL